ncbi:hypothetical protein LMG31506_00003 [Cupriavidus yeoncheonensis]|uniref:Integrase n=2 Tax=Cupriavidus yeoncheonensis TaxID=1462994 RepID=A0A916MSU0_9BURK|nr:hypothetical protein LMG31506_00003 [Cupriavidus yeoncheonensis]
MLKKCGRGLSPLLDVPVCELDANRIAEWDKQARLSYEDSTVTSLRAMLKQILDFACRLDLLAQFPTDALPRLPLKPPRQFMELTRHDHWAILQELNTSAAAMRAARDRHNLDQVAHHRVQLPSLWEQTFVDHLPVIYIFLRETGAGYSQSMHMPWSDVDLPPKEWSVTSRSGCRWNLPLSDLAWETMSRWREQCPGLLVFPGKSPGGQALNIRPRWLHLLERAGLPLITLENLRRDFIERIADAGCHLPTAVLSDRPLPPPSLR